MDELQMNKTTQLTKSIPEFMKSWNAYKKGLNGLKITYWCISSDYCFNDKDKHDVATFTIFPADYMKGLLAELKENLPRDIKDIRDFSEKELNYIKNSKYYFSISVLINNIKASFDKDAAIKQVERLLKIRQSDFPFYVSENEFRENHDRLQELYKSLTKKNCPYKLLAETFFVAHFVACIIEFLLIKENSKHIGWCSDRGNIVSNNKNTIFNLVNMYVNHYLKFRISNYHLAFASEITKDLDYFIRIPDIITGAISSLIATERGIVTQKKKHCILMNQSIIDNTRILALLYDYDENGTFSGRRMFFESLDKCQLFKFEREYLKSLEYNSNTTVG